MSVSDSRCGQAAGADGCYYPCSMLLYLSRLAPGSATHSQTAVDYRLPHHRFSFLLSCFELAVIAEALSGALTGAEW